jgi:hypothetical protein
MKKTITLSFRPQLSDNEQVVIDPSVLEGYERAFVDNYAEKSNWYRIGRSSGNVIHEGVTYGDISEFAKKVDGNHQLEKHVMENNAHLESAGKFGYGTWISLWDYMFNTCEEAINTAILSANNVDVEPFSAKTYSFEGNEVVFFSFYQACYGEATIYAVPKDVAIKLHLQDFEGEVMSRNDELWRKLELYEVKEDLVMKASCIEAFNYD